MDYRLMAIKNHSNSIDKNREIIRSLTLPEKSESKIIDDLEELTKSLKKYGNPIRYPLIIDGEEKYFVIEAYSKELYSRYYICDRYPSKNKDGEKIIICFSLDPKLTFEQSTKLVEQRNKAKENGKYFPEEIFFPMSTLEKSFLIYNWKEIYNDLLEFILKKLKKEQERQEIKIQKIKEINDMEE